MLGLLYWAQKKDGFKVCMEKESDNQAHLTENTSTRQEVSETRGAVLQSASMLIRPVYKY